MPPVLPDSRTTATPEPPHLWMRRFARLRLRFALLLAAAALLVGVVMRVTSGLFGIRPGKGTPVGIVVRTPEHLATWIQTLETYVPSPARDHGRDRYTLSVLLVPLDGGEPQLVPVRRGLRASEFALARVLGSDGRSLWVEAGTTAAIDLATLDVHEPVGPPPSRLSGSPDAGRARLQPNPDANLAAGFVTESGQWVGLCSAEELERDVAPGKFVRRVASATRVRQPRRLHRATLEAVDAGHLFRVGAIAPVSDVEFLDAAFLRAHEAAEPVRVGEPDSALLLCTSAPGLAGTLVVARVTVDGEVVWRVDTGIDRFALRQILPGATSTAFVGTRPRQPDRVPEPLLVLVEHASGTAHSHSLWQGAP